MSLETVSLCWLLVGYCALLELTAAQALRITQKPRFYGVMTNRKVGIYCMSSKQHLRSNVTWYKAPKFDKFDEKSLIPPGGRSVFRNKDLTGNAFIILNDLRIEDQGVYFCEINGVYGPGTQVRVTRPVDEANFLYRSQMKDALIILQALLLALIIAAFGFRKKTLSDKEESIYEEPEVDHIYEGLAIETCEDADLYEEISVYAQAEGAEAPWE